MAGNADPIYSKVGDIQSGNTNRTVTNVCGFVANTSQAGDSSSTSMYDVYQADATNGGYLQKLSFQSVKSPAATVCRIFISSITGALTLGTTNTSLNTWLFTEIGLPLITVSNSVAAPHIEVPMNLAMPPGYRILISFGTTTGVDATQGWSVTAIAGKY